MIIVFSGTDGAGKSTQITLLRETLQDRSYRTYTVWARGGYTPGFELLKRVIRKLPGISVPGAGRSKARSKALARPLISRLWLIVAILDLTLLYGVVIRLRSLLGQVVICDRYLGDTALDFQLNFPQIDFERLWLWWLLSWVAPKPDCLFLMLLPVSVSMERSMLKYEPFPDSEETLEKRLSVYQTSAWFEGFVRIDALQRIEVIADQIQRSVLLFDAT
jgi:thymidylate kinase